MTKLLFSPAAERDLKHLESNVIFSLENEHLPELVRNSRIGKMLHGPLKGYFSYDFAEGGVAYRIAYEIFRGRVIILMVDTRENFYKKFSRRIR